MSLLDDAYAALGGAVKQRANSAFDKGLGDLVGVISGDKKITPAAPAATAPAATAAAAVATGNAESGMPTWAKALLAAGLVFGLGGIVYAVASD